MTGETDGRPAGHRPLRWVGVPGIGPVVGVPRIPAPWCAHGLTAADRRGRLRWVRLAALIAALSLSAACQATSVPGLNIRARPTTASPVIDNMARVNTSVRITCSTRGSTVHGTDLWYRISSPRAGYVTSYYVHADSNTASVPPC